MDRSNVKTRPATGNMANIVARHNQRRSPKKDSNDAEILQSPPSPPILSPTSVDSSNSLEGFEDNSRTIRGQSFEDSGDAPKTESAVEFEDSSRTIRGQRVGANLDLSEANAATKFEDNSRTIQGQCIEAADLLETLSSPTKQDEFNKFEDNSGTVRGQHIGKDLGLLSVYCPNPVSEYEDSSGTIRGQPSQKLSSLDLSDIPKPIAEFEDSSRTVRGQPSQNLPTPDPADIPKPTVEFEDSSRTVRGQPSQKSSSLDLVDSLPPVAAFEDSSRTVRGQPSQKSSSLDLVDSLPPVAAFEDSSRTVRGQTVRTSIKFAGGKRGVEETDYWSRSDLSKKILKAVGAHCDEKLARISRPMTHKYIATLVDSTVESVKKTLQRLEQSGYLLRIKAKSGPQGWTVYQMPLTIFVEVQNDRDVLKVKE